MLSDGKDQVKFKIKKSYTIKKWTKWLIFPSFDLVGFTDQKEKILYKLIFIDINIVKIWQIYVIYKKRK